MTRKERLLNSIYTLSEEDAKEALVAVAFALWPGGDPDVEWSPDTLAQVSEALVRHKLHPGGNY